MPMRKRAADDFTNKQHEQHCKEAGCSHPAVYRFAKGKTVQGWCMLCRQVAFGS